jgi:magnesium transporter
MLHWLAAWATAHRRASDSVLRDKRPPSHERPAMPDNAHEESPGETWERIALIIAARDAAGLQSYLETLPPAEVARAISRLDQDDQTELLTLLDSETAADILEEVSDVQAVDLIEDLPPERAAAIVEEMHTDEQADLLGGLDRDDAEAILGAMKPEAARGVRQLLRYPAESAGGLMVTEFLEYPEGSRVADVLGDLREHGEAYSDYDVQYAYVTAANGGLVGVLRLRDLLFAPREAPISSLMIKDPIAVAADASLDELQQLFEAHGFFGVPATNASGDLVGIVRRAAVKRAVGEQASGLFLKVSGIIGGEELRSMPLASRSFRRLSWLSINIVLNIVAASVIAFYQDTLEQAITLAVFLPIVSDMSGCSGNQAVAVSIRELSLGLVRPSELPRVLLKESALGLFNGVVLGGLLGGVAMLWRGNPYLGVVVGSALALNTVVSVCLGGVLPLILKRFRVDPALVSGPLLTTVTDMCGFFLVLRLAGLVLPRLT